MCPAGWACNDPSVNSADLKLWKQEDYQIYYKKISADTWEKIRYTSTLDYLKIVSQKDDTVVLFSINEKQYVILDSKSCFTGPTEVDARTSKPYFGSWLFIYYEAASNFIKLSINFKHVIIFFKLRHT